MKLWRLANPKSTGWSSRLETQGRINVKFKSKGSLLADLLLGAGGDKSLFYYSLQLIG